MTSFAEMDIESRTYALVGKFLFEWAYMESQINKAIGKALNLKGPHSAIVAFNLQFRDKIHLLRAAVHYSGMLSEEEKTRLKAMLKDINEYASVRNMIAHTPFIGTDDGGVEFVVIKARGELQFPEEIWSVTRFEEAYEKLSNYAREMQGLSERLSNAALIAALMARPPAEPTKGLGGLIGLGLLFPQPQGDPDSDTDPSTG